MSGSLVRAFLDDMVANIDDDTPRLVYADWLEEHGHDDRAEFIRVQVELARLPAWDAAHVRLRLREQVLLAQHGEEWLAELPAIEGAKWEGFRRGIIAEVSFVSFEALRASAHACRKVAPIEAVTVRWPRKGDDQASTPIAELRELSLTGRAADVNEIAWLADSPQLATLRSLTGRGLWAEGLGRLLASPHLGGLEILRLPSHRGPGRHGLLALIGTASLTSLEELDLSGWGFYEQYTEDAAVAAAGVEALAGWVGMAKVRALALSENSVCQEGLRALLRSPHTGALKALSLRDGRLDGQALAEFNEALSGPRLEVLDLGENLLDERGVANLASARCLNSLKDLRLDRCEIPLTAGDVLANAPFMDGLRLLDVGYNYLGSVGLAALLERRPPALHTLRMRNNNLFDKGAALLAGSPASDTLLEVDLSQNDLGTAAARTLGESSHLRALLVLRLTQNQWGLSDAATLAASPLGQRLAVLDVENPPPPSDGDAIPF